MFVFINGGASEQSCETEQSEIMHCLKSFFPLRSIQTAIHVFPIVYNPLFYIRSPTKICVFL